MTIISTDRLLVREWTEVFAVVLAGNDASMAVARRLGMTHVGIRTDWYGGEELETFVLRRDSEPFGGTRAAAVVSYRPLS